MKVKVFHPYFLHANFVGRDSELRNLNNWIKTDKKGIFIIEALGGAGKSALAWVWLHINILHRSIDAIVKPNKINTKIKRVFWWSFYYSESKFRDFIYEFSKVIGIPDETLDYSTRISNIITHLQKERCLIILDGLERILFAYNNIEMIYKGDDVGELSNNSELSSLTDLSAKSFFRTLASSGMNSRILITTRLIPNEFIDSRFSSRNLIAGIEKLSLKGLGLKNAVIFFKSQGFKCHNSEVKSICAPIHYHPLYIRLICGYLDTLDIKERKNMANAITFDGIKNLRAKKEHILKRLYYKLELTQQMLLSRLASFRSIIDINIVKVISPYNDQTILNKQLIKLERYGLIFIDYEKEVYDMHPIVRSYSYSRLSRMEKVKTHKKLASKLLLSRNISLNSRTESNVEHFTGFLKKIDSLDINSKNIIIETIEIYYHLIGSEEYNAAVKLYRERLSEVLFFKIGAYFEIIELLKPVVFLDQNFIKIIRKEDQIGILNAAAMAFSRIGMPYKAEELYRKAIAIANLKNLSYALAIVFQNLSEDLRIQGKFSESVDLISQSLSIGEKLKNQDIIGLAYRLRGYMLNITGNKYGFEELNKARIIFSKRGHNSPLFYVHTNKAWCHLFFDDFKSAIKELKEAENILDITHFARDYVRVHFLFGKAYRMASNFIEAELHLNSAIERCREKGLVEIEADILIELGLVYLNKNNPNIKLIFETFRQALEICKKSSFRIQESDLHMAMALFSEKTQIKFDTELNSFSKSKDYINTTIRELELSIEYSLGIKEDKANKYNSAYLKATKYLQLIKKQNSTNMIKQAKKYIVHISDLHLSGENKNKKYVLQLKTDFAELSIGKPNLIIISGDITNTASKYEYGLGLDFIRLLLKEFGLTKNHLLIVPGNHDVNWVASKKSYELGASVDNKDENKIISIGKDTLIRNDKKYKLRFKNYYSDFYNKLYRNKYDLKDFKSEYYLQINHDIKLVVLGINSSWELDHHFTSRASVNMECLSNAISKIETFSLKNYKRIFVSHHPAYGSEAITNEAVLDLLSTNKFKIFLHGHIHTTKHNVYKYDKARSIHIIGAGTFAVQSRGLAIATPWQYNVFELEATSNNLKVFTRKRENEDGAWFADARWGNKNNPKSFYNIKF